MSDLQLQVTETEEALAAVQGAAAQTQQVMVQLQERLQDAIEADKAARDLLNLKEPQKSGQVLLICFATNLFHILQVVCSC